MVGSGIIWATLRWKSNNWCYNQLPMEFKGDNLVHLKNKCYLLMWAHKNQLSSRKPPVMPENLLDQLLFATLICLKGAGDGPFVCAKSPGRRFVLDLYRSIPPCRGIVHYASGWSPESEAFPADTRSPANRRKVWISTEFDLKWLAFKINSAKWKNSFFCHFEWPPTASAWKS